jgi:hypothetical protein
VSAVAKLNPGKEEVLAAIDAAEFWSDHSPVPEWGTPAAKYEARMANRCASFGLRSARTAVEKLFAAAPKIDRDTLAAAAHRHFCLMPGEPTHEPDEIDYDKADEILEILAHL